ncbi:MAG: DMT family transporter [Planctomycetota bacterium]
MSARAAVFTMLALAAFAANSLLCRAALGAGSIDAASFTAVRLASGAVASIALVLVTQRKREGESGGSLASAAALFAYAAAFSLAYVRIATGVGALVLFGCVQLTMIGWSAWRGARPTAKEAAGVAIAFAGLAVLTLPGAVAPDPIGVGSMALAGVAWGVYSLRGRGSRSPLRATAANFALTVPMAALGLLVAWLTSSRWNLSSRGVVLAAASGVLASGVGYTVWYAALRELSATRAAALQLLVPVLAALSATVLLDERITARLVVAGALVLGGVATATWWKRPASR